MTTVLCVPQWQGSMADRAKWLAAGARAAAGLVPAGNTVTVPVLDTNGGKVDGVRALDVIVENLRLTEQALAGIDGKVITVGGDCGVELAPIAAARAQYGDRLTVLWIDAHPDLFSPRTLPSGSFHGMVLRTLLGDGAAPLVPAEPLKPEQVIHAGLRAGEPSEHEYRDRSGIRACGVENIEEAFNGLTGPVYVHLDLDVLDPSEFTSVGYPEPDGVSSRRLADLIAGLDNVVGGAITEYAPTDGVPSAGEGAVIRRLGVALSR